MDKTKEKQLFPKDFLWGASVSSHQVEGNNVNQWTVWELENAARLATIAAEHYDWTPKWEDIKDQAIKPENYISGNAIEHYTRYKEDFKLAKSLNLNSFRFGIEWSRVEPEEGQWNEVEWEHYRTYIQELSSQGLEPILNLWHWTMPTWFTDKGAFKKRKNIKYFTRFVERACKELPIDKLKYVITLNEPNVYASFSYLTAEWPPAEKSPIAFARVYYNLTTAHKKSYSIIKRANRHAQVGVATQLANIQAKRPQNVIDLVATRWMRYFWNWWYLNRIKKYQDFVGVNYYFSDYYQWGDYKHARKMDLTVHKYNPEFPKSDVGWYMEPEGIYPLLQRTWTHYEKPIMVTENGLADRDDEYRRWWIEETIVSMERALSEGVQVIGYMHWSLLDNFEWAFGWWPEFGLIHVDRETKKRTVRDSAKYYAEQIEKFSK